MKFAKAYEPGEYEAEVYGAWEAAGVFLPKKQEMVSLGQFPSEHAEGEDLAQYSSEPAPGRLGQVFMAPQSIGPKPVARQRAFSIVMPPPNANGNLHIGHGLTIAIQDTLVRYHRLLGEPTWYIPGADHAGFETWVVYERVLEKQKQTRFMFTREELYARVWDFVQEQRGGMELQVRALGASCSWRDLTFTLDENVVRRVYATFEKMWKDGLIYRGEKLVNYCTKHQTAFADIEVVHRDEEGTLWSVAYPLLDGTGEIVVSTTRPETMFGDVAVAVNPADERYKEMIGRRLKLPLTERDIPVIADEHAEIEYGTGAVKITPAHDYDDFEVGERHDLPRLTVIGFDGKMLPAAGEYAGMESLDCRKKVLKDLAVAGLLRGEKKISHVVAHCYKCDTVVEPLLKDQWFIDVEKLAARAIEHLERGEIKFYPESKGRVLVNYLKNLHDWNISRQIPWGIAIPMFRRVDTEGADGRPEWIFDNRTHLSEIEIGGVRYKRDEDTFDTWFSSGHWPIVCTNWEEGLENPFYPLNVMETGADILFAWVARMIMIGLYVTDEVPFREVYLHGLVLDEKGQKMSKSKGNVINPMELVGKYGSDAFRLGILRGRSAGMNQAFAENSVISGRNLCNKLWNIARLVQGMVDAEVAENGYSVSELTTGAERAYETNRMGEDWICRELEGCRVELMKMLEEYRLAEAVELLHATIWDKYADWFVESQKLAPNIPLLTHTLAVILTMLHPFAPFVTETIWQNLSWTEGLLISQQWPLKLIYDEISAEKFERLMDVVSETRGTLQRLPGGKKWALLYGDDSLVAENSELVKFLTRVPEVVSVEGQPRGLRLALANNELYLDVPEKVVLEYKESLEERILAVGRELDALNLRMMNPRYVERAPAELVRETRNAIAEKEALIEGLKRELKVI